MNEWMNYLFLSMFFKVAKAGSERRYLIIGAVVCTCACVYLVVARRRKTKKRIEEQKKEEERENVSIQDAILESVVGEAVVESVANALVVVPSQELQEATPEDAAVIAAREKSKRKKAKLKKGLVDGVSLVMGDEAGKFVETVMDLSKKAKGLESLKSGKLSGLFTKDIIPILKKKLQKKKFPTIVGTTDSALLGDLSYEISGITLESLDINPSIQCDITDKNEALQIKLLISSAKLKNISWKCGTKKIQEKGTANAEIVKANCMFRITVDRSEKFPKLSIKHCEIELEQFNLELFGGKASWVYNMLTSLFSNKIKTKVKEKIDKMLTKRCRQFESKINLAATHLISLFSSKKKRERIEAQQVTPHKKCFLFSSESAANELECVLLDLRQFATIADLQIAFFGELGLEITQAVRVRFRDRTGTLVTVSKSTTIEQIIEHAEHICFYHENLYITSSTSSLTSITSSSNSLLQSSGNLLEYSSSSNNFANLSHSQNKLQIPNSYNTSRSNLANPSNNNNISKSNLSNSSSSSLRHRSESLPGNL
eukprot:Phypoly_transcript_05257.p1 GENE.Phypoly_transcript_05257~~Phypoly_transcript_05257.p1  ORF type:complete len:542 (+),score=134.82 Phypoly_transcript_05257:318-1943(+)